MIVAGGFLTEHFWAAGDLRWAYVLLAGAITIPLLYSPEIWGFILRQASNASKPARPLGKSFSEQYASHAHADTVTFNYSDNDRKYRIGEGEYKFVTRWSPCGEDSVYLYRGGDHSSVALTDKSAIEVQQILSGPQGRGRTGGCNLQWAPPLGCGEGHRHRKGRAYVPVRHPDRWHVEVCTMSPGHQLPIGSDAF